MLSQLHHRDILWLKNVKRASLSATISSNGCLKLVSRQALIVPISFLARFSLNVQSLFGVPGDFNLGEPLSSLLALMAILTVIQDFWSVLLPLYALFP